MSWHKLSAHHKSEVKTGLLSEARPPLPELTSEQTIERDIAIKPLDQVFSDTQSKEPDVNVALLDSTLSNICDGYIFRAFEHLEAPRGSVNQVGFILSIPHRIRLNLIHDSEPVVSTKDGSSTKREELPLPSSDIPDDEAHVSVQPREERPSSDDFKGEHRVTIRSETKSSSYATALTTHLCVHKDHRSKGLAMALIRAAITHGYEHGVYTGYHYIGSAKTLSHIPVKAWYRPLNAKEAARVGYTLVVPPVKGVRDYGRLAAMFYRTGVKHKYRPTILTDFSSLQVRKVSLDIPTEIEWKRLNSSPLIWQTLLSPKGKVEMVGCYRSFPIQRDGFKAPIKAAQIVYVETATSCSGKDELAALESFLGVIEAAGYVVIHGLAQGPLVEYADRLKLVQTSFMYLDFYNLNLDPPTLPQQVNLLYV